MMAASVRKAALGLAAVLVTSLALVSAVGAVEPDEILEDPALEARARNLSLELRCLVCQNQSIDDSNAPLARDLRIIVRERLKAGDSDQEVLNFIVSRYGEFVLLRPPFNARTLLLWLTPALALLAALWLSYRAITAGRGPENFAHSASGAEALTPEEEAKLRRILEQK